MLIYSFLPPKYSHDTSLPNSLSHFIQKLKQKNQSEQQIEQAKTAIYH
jgi:hypothetical protein